MKSGVFTTEFWLTVIKSSIALLIATGKIQPGDAKTLEGATTNIIVSIFSLLAGAHVLATYIRSRATVKSAAADVAIPELAPYLGPPPPTQTK